MATASVDKYDRQLRLWGASGQRALMEVEFSIFLALTFSNGYLSVAYSSWRG